MEFEGRIIQIMPTQSGISQSSGNAWMSQEFLMDHYWWPNQTEASKAVIKLFGADRIQQADIHVNDEVRVRCHIEAREYNGRWYNEVRCDGITKVGASARQQNPIPQAGTTLPPTATSDNGQNAVPPFTAEAGRTENVGGVEVPFFP